MSRTSIVQTTNSRRRNASNSTTIGRPPNPNNPRRRNGIRFRNFLFTINNPSPSEDSALQDLEPTYIKYIIYQREIGENGTHHIQGYAELVKQTALSTIQKLEVRGVAPFAHAHLEHRRGTQQQAIQYCCKLDTRMEGTEPIECGTPSRGGARADFVESMMKGTSKKELQRDYPMQYLQNANKIDKFRETIIQPRNHKMNVVIYVGPTGTYKSFCASQLYPEAYHGVWPTGNRWWWPNYDGEKEVILDEFRHQVKYDTMLKLLDRYPWKIEFKGGNREFNSSTLVITTNIHPKDWYPKVRDRAPLIRRINEYAKIWLFDYPDGEEQEGEDDQDEEACWEKVNRKRDMETIPLPEIQETSYEGGWNFGRTTRTTTVQPMGDDVAPGMRQIPDYEDYLY